MTNQFRGWANFLLVVALAAMSAYAADDPFVGTWKLNPDKSQFAGQVVEIRDLGGNKYLWVYNSSTPDEYLADGKEHPTPDGGTYLLSQESPDRQVRTYKRNGQVMGVSVWTLLNGGSQLKMETKATRPDGSSNTEKLSLTRIGIGSGFAGKWEIQESQASSVWKWVIKPLESGGLSFSVPVEKEHQEMKFDGKDYPDYGPRVTPGATSCAKRIDEHTIQLTNKLNGKATSTHEMVVSADGMTLTDTRHVPGQTKPIVQVFEKQM